MEGTSKEQMEKKGNPEVQQQNNNFSGSLMLDRYEEYANRLIESTCEKIFSGEKIKQYLTPEVSARKEGHLNIIAEQLKIHTHRVLGVSPSKFRKK